MPDSLISDRLRQNTLGNALDTRANVRNDPGKGVQSVVPGNLSAFGDARRTILGLTLDNTVGGQKSTLNKAGYITALNSSLPAALTLGAEIHDLTKAKDLFKSMIESNPNNPKSWQGAARIMELDGNIEEARNIIAQGVEKCPDSEDVWYEAIRLEERDKQKPLAAKAVITCPKSTKLWLIAASLETDKERKSKVLKKALQSVPQSDKLWKELIDTAADDQEAIDFLAHAVECVPVAAGDPGQSRLPPRPRETAAVQRSEGSREQGEPALQERRKSHLGPRLEAGRSQRQRRQVQHHNLARNPEDLQEEASLRTR